MGKLPLSVTVSATVHVVLVGWFASRELSIDHRDDDVAAPTLTTVELVDAPAIALATSASIPSSSSAVDVPVTGGQITTGTAGTTRSSSEPSTPGVDKPRSPYLDMRRGGHADLTLPGTRDDLDHAPAGTKPQPGLTSKRAHKADEGSFIAKVDKDGGVTINDRSDFSIRWALPTPKLIGRGFADWYESDKGPDGKRGKRTLENEVSGSVDKPTAGCEGVRDNACSPDRSVTVIVPVFRGGFNPTDWLMRRTVGDPYASKKRAYLDATRDERAQIGATHRSEQLKQTAIIMRRNLERAWGSTTDVRERKQVVFELWDEIAEPADEESAVAEASRAARAQVIGFIRARLPQRGQDAYSASEIAALNAKKQSKETFSPYE